MIKYLRILDIYNIKSVSLKYLVNYSIDHAIRNNNSIIALKIIRDIQLSALIYITIDNYKFYQYLNILNINIIDLYNSFNAPNELKIELSDLEKITIELSNTYVFDKLKELIEFISNKIENNYDELIFICNCVLHLYKFYNSEINYLLKRMLELDSSESEDIKKVSILCKIDSHL